jgi:RNA polymerase sigma-70 factor (sigma-E family)
VTRPQGAEQEFADFVTKHSRGLGRLAYLLVGDEHAAEDLTADVLLAAWRQWHQVTQAQYPLAYLRQVMVNQAAARYRRRAKERLSLERLRDAFSPSTTTPDSATVVDVRSALLRLPPRRRACLVLRFAFDLSEREVAETLGISVGTVKSQTSKAAQQFRREVGETLVETYATALPAAAAAQLRKSRNGD